MRKLWILIALAFITSCGYKYPVNGLDEKGVVNRWTRFPSNQQEMNYLALTTQLCYRTRHGVSVYHTRDSWCPDRADVQAVFTRYDREHNIDPMLWDGIILVATSYNILCGEIELDEEGNFDSYMGCADRNGLIMVTVRGRAFGGKYDWAQYLYHELDHMDSFIYAKSNSKKPRLVDGKLE